MFRCYTNIGWRDYTCFAQVWLLPELFSFCLDLSRRELSTILRLPGARSFLRAATSAGNASIGQSRNAGQMYWRGIAGFLIPTRKLFASQLASEPNKAGR